jgi:hypothetical protein
VGVMSMIVKTRETERLCEDSSISSYAFHSFVAFEALNGEVYHDFCSQLERRNRHQIEVSMEGKAQSHCFNCVAAKTEQAEYEKQKDLCS